MCPNLVYKICFLYDLSMGLFGVHYKSDHASEVISAVEKLTGMDRNEEGFPRTAEALSNLILHTCYMGSVNSSESAKRLAGDLAKEVGAYHFRLAIDSVVEAFLKVFSLIVGKTPRFVMHGGTHAEDLALQVRPRLVVIIIIIKAVGTRE